LNSNKLILGTVQFGLDYGINNKQGQVSERSIKEILDLAFENGINILDTAEGYGDSQERIGNYHKNSSNIFNIVTKFHASTHIDASFDIKERVLSDISLLRVEKLYGYMFHSFSDFNKYFDVFKEDLFELKSKGFIHKIGVSVYTNAELEKILETKEIEIIQLPYNLLDNDKLRGKSIRKAKEKGIEIHTRSAFLQGLFFKPVSSLSGNLLGLKDDINNINRLGESHKIKMASCALNYPVSKSYIDKVLIGVDSLEQLKNNIKATENDFDKSIYEKIDCIQIKNTKLLNPSNWKI